MPIADRGYQPYEGPRLPTRRNHWVITGMELRRIWASLLVKIVMILAVIFAILKVGWMFVQGYLMAELGAAAMPAEAIAAQLTEMLSPAEVLDDIDGQLVFAILISLGWGAGAIASDIRSRAFQFYFAKPITERLYLLGKITPLAFYCFLLCVIPGIFDPVVQGALLNSQGLLASRVALILPSVLYSAILAVFLSTMSIGISSLAKNRLLTLAYWAAILFVPLAVSNIVDLATSGDFQWLYLISPLSMARLLGQAIFRLDIEGPIQWYHALVVLVVLCSGSVWVAWKRLSKTEVVG